jgi:hypothetical protein
MYLTRLLLQARTLSNAMRRYSSRGRQQQRLPRHEMPPSLSSQPCRRSRRTATQQQRRRKRNGPVRCGGRCRQAKLTTQWRRSAPCTCGPAQLSACVVQRRPTEKCQGKCQVPSGQITADGTCPQVVELRIQKEVYILISTLGPASPGRVHVDPGGHVISCSTSALHVGAHEAAEAS